MLSWENTVPDYGHRAPGPLSACFAALLWSTQWSYLKAFLLFAFPLGISLTLQTRLNLSISSRYHSKTHLVYPPLTPHRPERYAWTRLSAFASTTQSLPAWQGRGWLLLGQYMPEPSDGRWCPIAILKQYCNCM